MLQTLTRATIAGITAFTATNLDDILVLMLFFSQVDRTFRRRHIVIGQYLGFMVLLLASLPGFLGGALIPRAWIGVLGLIPICIGLSHWFQQDETDTVQVNADLVHSSRIVSILGSQTYQVAAITIANGGDNIGIYLPLFASSTLIELSVILTVFLILIGVWCAIANYLAQHRLLAQPLVKYGKQLVPFVLIGLGLYILWDSEAYTLVLK